MTSKDSALFEVRKHNFNVLLSDDEEVKTEAQATEVSSPTEAALSKAPAAAAAASNDADDGFETFDSRKNKRTSGAKPRSGSFSAPSNTGHTSFKPFPKELIIPKPETSLELCDFPATLRTGDLRKLLQAYEGHYRLKWNHDTSCFVVFDDAALGKR